MTADTPSSLGNASSLVDLRTNWATLAEWIRGPAYQALLYGPLRDDPEVKGLPEMVVRISDAIEEERRIPVALVGQTGIGKSTLLNALLGGDFLPVGVIGSQTAAFVTIRHADRWSVRCRYITEDALRDTFLEAYASEADDEAQASYGPEIISRAQKRVRALLRLKEGEPLPPAYGVSPPQDALQRVALREEVFTGDEARCRQELERHAKGAFWPLTERIDVEGPFAMLESGVVISDLPGAGDVNSARVQQASEAIQQAGQVLIAASTRSFGASLFQQLYEQRLPHRLLRDGSVVQVIIVGTRLDTGLPDPDTSEGQIRDLGLDPATAEDADIFDAVCCQWVELVRGSMTEWLHDVAAEILRDLPVAAREDRVQQLIGAMKIVPTSAVDWVRHSKRKRMKYCRTPNATGVPRLRTLISDMAEAQLRVTRMEMQRRIEEAEQSVLSLIERSESMLGADIEKILRVIEESSQQISEVQNRCAQEVEDLRLSVLGRFREIRERINDRIENAALRMKERGRQRMTGHLEGLHWASLRATVRSGGRWTTNAGRSVNLRDAFAAEITGLVPQAWVQIADQRIEAEMDQASQRLRGYLNVFTANIRTVVEGESSDPLTRKTVDQMFAAALRRADVEVEKAADAVKKLRADTVQEMQTRIDAAVAQSLSAVCDACSSDHGTGWKSRSLNEITNGVGSVADEAYRRCSAIADSAMDAISKAVEKYCKTAEKEMQRIAGDLPAILKSAIERQKLAGPQEQRDRLQVARAARRAFSPSA